MSRGLRSPFGALLREERLKLGLSQSALADQIIERAARDPDFAELGIVSEKTISNLEVASANPSRFVRPRPHTVRILLAALNIAPGSGTETALLEAAEATRRRAGAEAPPEGTSESGLFVLDGRQDHFDRLHHAWTQARSGHPRIVFLAGDAGAGKTRMVLKFCDDLRANAPDIMIGWGECTSGASSVEPYLPFRQALSHIVNPGKHLRGTKPAWPSDAIQALLASSLKLANVMIDESALRNRMADQELSVQAELKQITETRSATDTLGRFDQLAQLLSSWSASWPIVLVLEDLHWAGEQACSLLLHLQRRFQRESNVPLLIIGTFRHSDLALPDPDTRHPLRTTINEIGRNAGNPVIDLSTSIGSDPGRAFINGLVGTIDVSPEDREALATLLFERTEGHPLFALELLQWLRDSNILRRAKQGNATWHFEKGNLEFVVPDRVRSVITERVGRLPDRQRKVLEIASIQGITVNFDILERLTGLSEDELSDILDDQLVTQHRLLRPGHVLEVANRRSYLYTFRHAVFQEYMYESLSRRRRDALHRETANAALEIFGRDDHPVSGEIAFHFARAHMPREAAFHADKAATVALRSLDYDLASIWLARTEDYAIQANDHHQIWSARSARVGVLRGTGDFDTGMRLAGEVLEQARLHGYRSLEAECHDLIAHIQFDRSMLPEAVHHLESAIRIHRELEKPAEASGSESMLSHAYYRLGAYDEARLHAQRAWKNAQVAGHDPFAAEALLAAGNCEVDLGMYSSAIQTYEQARHVYARCGEIRGEILTSLNTGLCHVQLGNWESALPILEEVRHTVDTLRTRRLHAICRLYLGFANEAGGQLDEAARAYSDSLAIRTEIGLTIDCCDNIAGLLRIALARGDRTPVRGYLDTLQGWLDTNGPDGIEEPTRIYLSMQAGYEALGKTSAANDALEAGYALLMDRASRITDDDARHSYLHHVPANRQLHELHVQKHNRG